MKIGSVALKYAVRSLTRHTRRTLISVVGTGVGCSMALISLSYMIGIFDMQVRAIAESGAGHLRVAPKQWTDTRENTLRLTDWERVRDAVRELPGLEQYTVRARATGLLAFGVRSAAAQITAVLPEKEYASNRMLQRGRIEGRYLNSDDNNAVVIGRTLARRLDVQLDDDLYVTMSGKDDIHAAMLHIVGILDTGSQDLDLSFCHITLHDLEKITGIQGAGEVSVLLLDERYMPTAAAQLAAALSEEDAVITWREVNPALAVNADGDEAFMRLLTGIVVLVVALGIMSAQLTAVLERSKEFAMLAALGMKRAQLVLMVMIEAVVIGLGGALVALCAGGSGAYYLSTRGLNLGALMEDDLGFGDVLFDPVLYGVFGPWLIVYAVVIALTTTILATLYPAWKAAQVMPADALRTTG